MYQNQLSNNEFLFSFYTLLEKKIKEIISLNTENKKLSHIKKIAQIKQNLLEAIYLLSIQSKEPKLQLFFDKISLLIVSNDNKDLETVLNICSNIKKY